MSKTIVIDAREILSSTGRYISKLVQYLQQLDHNNQYHLLIHKEAFDQVKVTVPNFHKQQVTSRKFTVNEQLKLPGEINKLQPDLVHFCMTQQPALCKGKRVTTIHDLTRVRFSRIEGNQVVYKIRQYIYKWLTKHVAHRSDAIITGSEYAKKDVIDYTRVNPDKVHVTLEAAEKITEPTEPITDLHDKNFIFYVGRADTHKNIDGLVKAFAKLHESKSELILALAGKKQGNYERIEELVQQLGLDHATVFTDFVSDGQLRWMYENAAAYVFPSFSEGFGLPGLEAMVHGCPVVSSNATCLPEIYGDAAAYFDPHDVDQMASVILDVIDNPDQRKTLIAKGRQQAGKYSWERMAQETLEVYKRVLGQK